MPAVTRATAAFDGVTPYSQNFDSLASSGTISWTDDSTTSGTVNSLPGWFLQHQTVTAVPDGYHRFRTGTGSSSTGQFYDFGVAGTNAVTDRSLGILGSTTVDTQWMGLRLENTSTGTITSVTISFDAEQWRVGTLTSNQTLTFGYKVQAGSLPETFSTSSSLNFASPKNAGNATSGALDGNAAGNRATKTATLTGLTWEPGQDLWIRWSAPGASGSHGFGIDNLTVTAAGTTAGAGSPTWNLDTNANWEAPGVADGSWLNSNAPAATANLVRLGSQITADRTVTLNTSPTVTTLEVNTSGHDYTLAAAGGNQLNVAAGGSIVSNGVAFFNGGASGGLPSNGTQIAAPVNFAGDASFRINDPMAKMTVSGTITIPAGAGYRYGGAGGGNITLPAGFTWSGTTTLDGAALSVSSLADPRLGDNSATNNLALDNGGRLTVTGDLTIAKSLSVGSGGGTLSHTGTITVAGAVSGPGILTKTGAGTLVVSGSTFRPAGFATLNPNTVQVAPSSGPMVTNFIKLATDSNGIYTGKLDVTDGGIVYDYTGTSPLLANAPFNGSTSSKIYVAVWYAANHGAWDRTGITSSYINDATNDPSHVHVLALAEASELGITGPSTFDGQAVDATTLLIKYTLAGDANMNGKIDADDYAIIDRTLAKNLFPTGDGGAAATAGTLARWVNGDFNYDGAVNSADMLLIDKSLATQNGGALSPEFLAMREGQFGEAYVQSLVASVPEPGAVSLVGAGLLRLLGRRQRRAVR